jgi:hypothetical protein
LQVLSEQNRTLVEVACDTRNTTLKVAASGGDDDVMMFSSILFISILTEHPGSAVAQRLDAGFPPRRPGFAYGHHVGFVVDKAALEQVFLEYFGFPCQSFHRFHHYHNHPGLTL